MGALYMERIRILNSGKIYLFIIFQSDFIFLYKNEDLFYPNNISNSLPFEGINEVL